jgi:hypothetical protein
MTRISAHLLQGVENQVPPFTSDVAVLCLTLQVQQHTRKYGSVITR